MHTRDTVIRTLRIHCHTYYMHTHRRLLQEEEFCVVDILVKVRVSETQIGVGENPQYLQENINLL